MTQSADTQAAWEAVSRRVERLGMVTLAVGYGKSDEEGVGGGWWYQPENPAWGIFHGGWVHDCLEDTVDFEVVKEGPRVPVSLESDGRSVRRVGVVQAECLCGARLLSLVEESEQERGGSPGGAGPRST